MYLPKSQYISDKLSELKDKIPADLGTFPVPKGDLKKYSNYLKVLQNISLGNPDVILTSFGEIFSRIGVDLNKGDFSNAIKLYPLNPDEDRDEGEDLNTSQLSSESKIKTAKLPPSTKEINAGVMKRCFYKNLSTGKVKEINKPIATKLSRNRQRFEQVVCIDWKIKGPGKDQLINGYFLEGIETKNQKILNDLKEIMPGAETLISSPSEFVEDSLPIAAKTKQLSSIKIDIPSPGKSIMVEKSMYNKYSKKQRTDEVKENLYAQPGQFLIEGTNKEYVGLYHLHPTKGPMVGADHINSPHSRLVPRGKAKSRLATEVVNKVDKTITIQPVNTSSNSSSTTYTSNNSVEPSTNTPPATNSGGYSSGESSGGY